VPELPDNPISVTGDVWLLGNHRLLCGDSTSAADIGWHKDKAVFGISLLSDCVFRFRRKTGTTWQRASLKMVPHSAYVLQGPARTEWEHSIAGVESLRYSITFRNVLSANKEAAVHINQCRYRRPELLLSGSLRWRANPSGSASAE
jgi:hypothetical protein